MRSITIWTAIGIFSLTSFGIGLAMGHRTESIIDAIYCLQKDWQGLTGAFTSLLAAAATVMAGFLALRAAEKQIKHSENLAKTGLIAKHRATRIRILIGLKKISEYCSEAFEYINTPSANPAPAIGADLLSDISEMTELPSRNIQDQSVNLMNHIQLADAWVHDFQRENPSSTNGKSLTILRILMLYALSLKWYDFTRFKSDKIDGEISRKDVLSAIATMERRGISIFQDNNYDREQLLFELRRHIRENGPEEIPPGP